METLRIGVIGLGVFGDMQASIISQLPNARLEALSSKTRSRVQSLGAKYGVKKLFTDYRDLINDSQIDAVLIVSNAEEHAQQARDAIMAGKHVFLEKPISLLRGVYRFPK